MGDVRPAGGVVGDVMPCSDDVMDDVIRATDAALSSPGNRIKKAFDNLNYSMMVFAKLRKK